MPCRTDLFAASVARSPCTDWVLQHLTSNIAEFDRRFLRGEVFDPDSQYAERSPLRHADRIRTPMLLTAGQQDLATPPSQAQVLHTALRERGVETQLVLYPEEGHGVRQPATVADQCARLIAWFDRHLSGGSSAKPRTLCGPPARATRVRENAPRSMVFPVRGSVSRTGSRSWS